MTTNSTIPASPAHRRREISRWVPRSAAAWTVLGLSAVATWPPAFFLAALGYLTYPGCFDTCGSRGQAAALYAAAAAAALTPLLAVRAHQAEQSAPPARRTLAAGVLVAVVAALAWWLWTFFG